MKKIPIYLIIISLILCIFSGSVYAFRSGNLEFNILGGASGSYDSNITYAHANKKTDFITALTAGLSGTYEGKLIAAQFVGNVIQQFFAENSKFDNTAENFSVNGGAELSKYDRIGFRDLLTHTYEPRSFGDEFGRTGGRYSYFRNSFNFDYTRDITKQFSAILRYNNVVDAPSASDLQTSYVNSGGVELDYALSSATTFLGSYDFTVRSFENSDYAITHSLLGGIRQYITKQLFIDARGGVDIIRSYDKTDYMRPRVDISATDDIDEKTRATLGFSDEYTTNSYSKDLFNYWQVQLELTRQIASRLSFSGSCFYGRGEYVAQAVKDDLIGINAGLSYDFTDNIKGTLRYSFSNTSSNFSLREYDRHLIYFGISAKF